MARMKIGGLNFYNDVWYNDFVVVVVGRPTTNINNKEKTNKCQYLFPISQKITLYSSKCEMSSKLQLNVLIPILRDWRKKNPFELRKK